MVNRCEPKHISQTLLLVGGSRGIGRAIGDHFASEGWRVLSPSRSELNLESPESVATFLGSWTTELNAVIFSAGVNNIKTFSEVGDLEFLDSFRLHVLSPFVIVQRLVESDLMLSDSAVLFISSLYGNYGRKGRLVYSTTKHATNGLVKNLAIELGEKGISVNSLVPGFVNTDMTRENLGADGIDRVKATVPVGRIAEPMEIAKIAFAICADCRYVTGQSVVVDGGVIAGGFWDVQ